MRLERSKLKFDGCLTSTEKERLASLIKELEWLLENPDYSIEGFNKLTSGIKDLYSLREMYLMPMIQAFIRSDQSS